MSRFKVGDKVKINIRHNKYGGAILLDVINTINGKIGIIYSIYSFTDINPYHIVFDFALPSPYSSGICLNEDDFNSINSQLFLFEMD